MSLWVYLFLIIVPFMIWSLCLKLQRPIPRMFNKSSILLVTAHPDDECMFFSPTIQALSKVATIRILCLSTGNDQGLGRVREKELQGSCAQLGIKDVVLVDDP